MMAFVGIDAQGDLLIDCRSDGGSNDVVVVSDLGSRWETYLNGAYRTFAKSAVGSYIECYLGDGNDYFENNTSLIADVEGGSGNDHLIGGSVGDGLDGGAGDDTLEGRDGHDYLFGGTEKDFLYGGFGEDTLDGYTGNDTLWGYYGNDTLYGSHGNDKLYGEAGNDKLYGEGGNDTYSFDADSIIGSDAIEEFGGVDTIDYSATTSVGVTVDLSLTTMQTVNANHKLTLINEDAIENVVGGAGADTLSGNALKNTLRGGAGNDNLYGKSGDDRLYGDAGNDGLFGGVSGTDALYGGAGADRFLRFQGSTGFAYINDKDSSDATVVFRNGGQVTSNKITYAAGSWSDAEIQRVDVGLAYLHGKTGNTKLLRYWGSGEITIWRQGYAGAGGAYGWNSNNGAISITDLGMTIADFTVVHEIGHNWDLPSETPFVNQFRDVSKWRTTAAATHSLSGDGKWYWQTSTSSTFASGPAKANPQEDWAWTWEAVYARDKGANPQRLVQNATKMAVIDAFFASLR